MEFITTPKENLDASNHFNSACNAEREIDVTCWAWIIKFLNLSSGGTCKWDEEMFRKNNLHYLHVCMLE